MIQHSGKTMNKGCKSERTCEVDEDPDGGETFDTLDQVKLPTMGRDFRID